MSRTTAWFDWTLTTRKHCSSDRIAHTPFFIPTDCILSPGYFHCHYRVYLAVSGVMNSAYFRLNLYHVPEILRRLMLRKASHCSCSSIIPGVIQLLLSPVYWLLGRGTIID